jgi:hypothetical protein
LASEYFVSLLFVIVIVSVILFFDNYLISDQQKNHFAYAHIFINTNNTVTKNINNYQLVFLPYPGIPIANDNSTILNFSLMENKTDVYNVFVSLIIKDRKSGNAVVEQIPYKFYEFGDIKFPYTFRNASNYRVTFQAKISGDPKYKVNPLKADFDIPVRSSELPFIGWIAVLIPILAAIPGIVVYMFFKRESNNENNNSIT